MPIAWRESMAVGDASIDADHQRLIECINAVEGALEAPHEVLLAALDALREYTVEHFAREESLMRVLGYNGLIEHRQAHRDLRDHLQRLRQQLIAARAEGTSEAQTGELIRLLRAWLLDHVLQMDFRLKPHLR
jgi:hemerythrin-like metal-binding protein